VDSERQGPITDPNTPNHSDASASTPSHQEHVQDRERIQPFSFPRTADVGYIEEPIFKEHITGYLNNDKPTAADGQEPPTTPGASEHFGSPPPFQHIPYQPPYPNYSYAVPSYPYAPYMLQPRRDGQRLYQLIVGILALVCSLLSFLGGLICLLLLPLIIRAAQYSRELTPDQEFASTALLITLSIAGLGGGLFSSYHSLRALFKKRSANFQLPWFWIFFVLYGIVIGIAFAIASTQTEFPGLPVAMTLIILAALLPALGFLALGTRIIHYPRRALWPTTWRRFTLSLTSGATLSILLAMILEMVVGYIFMLQIGIGSDILSQDKLPTDPGKLFYLFISLAVVAPVVEELVKPIGTFVMLGRIRSAGEAFIIGLAGGIGFNLVETTMYISQGYNDWLQIALLRSAAGLLHGFGAAMVSLGVYYLFHPKETGKYNHILLGILCIAYAIFQHGLWNGSTLLETIPFFANTLTIGTAELPVMIFVYATLALLMLAFFVFVSFKLRGKVPTDNASPNQQSVHIQQPAAFYPQQVPGMSYNRPAGL